MDIKALWEAIIEQKADILRTLEIFYQEMIIGLYMWFRLSEQGTIK